MNRMDKSRGDMKYSKINAKVFLIGVKLFVESNQI